MASVLVIDDSKLAAIQVERILGSKGVEVHHAATVAEVFGFKGAPSLLREHPPELILLDLLMPDMHGFDTLEKLKSMVKVSDIPVIVVSATNKSTDADEALHRGAKGFMRKPLEEASFLEKAAQVVKEAGQMELAKVLANYLSTGRQAENHDAALQVGDANLSYLLEIMDDDKDMLRHLVQVFVEDMPRQLERIKDGLDAKDPKAMGKAAHMYKGSVSNFAAALLTEMAQELEIKGREGDMSGCDTIYSKLEADSNNLRKELMAWLAF